MNIEKFKPVILTSVSIAIIFAAVGPWIIGGLGWSFLSYLLVVGVLMAAVQKETVTYKFLDKLLVGCLVFGYLGAALFFLVMRAAEGLPLSLAWLRDWDNAMALGLASVSFLGGLLGVVLKGFYVLYKDRLTKVIVFAGPLLVMLSSLSVFKVKTGGTVMSSLHGWPYPFFTHQIKDILVGFSIDKWIFSPGSFYHYVIFDYVLYLAIFLLAYGAVILVNKKLKVNKLNGTLSLFGLLVFVVLALTSYLPVKQSYISQQIAEAGYCQASADCVIVANRAPFSCAIIANKNEAGRIMSLVDSYPSTGELSCFGVTDTTCLNNRCQFSADDGSPVSVRDVEQAFLAKYPNWDKPGFFSVAIEENSPTHAMGTVSWPNNKGKGFWFATKANGQWIITDYTGGSYFGMCNNFQQYNFPADMTPDCWDEDKKIVINTPDPAKFYDGLTVADKDKIKLAFLNFKKGDSNYQGKDIYVKFSEHMDRYVTGMVIIGGIENYSTPYFLAAKVGSNWKVLYHGQEAPPCESLAGYDVPVAMAPNCWGNNGQEWVTRQ